MFLVGFGVNNSQLGISSDQVRLRDLNSDSQETQIGVIKLIDKSERKITLMNLEINITLNFQDKCSEFVAEIYSINVTVNSEGPLNGDSEGLFVEDLVRGYSLRLRGFGFDSSNELELLRELSLSRILEGRNWNNLTAELRLAVLVGDFSLDLEPEIRIERAAEKFNIVVDLLC